MSTTIKEHLAKAIEKNDRLCKLGNGDVDGNSNGNVIAQDIRQHLAAIEAALDRQMKSVSDADEYVKDIISHDEAIEMVSRMIHSHFKRVDVEHMRASIPANPKRDDDLRMIAYIKQQKMKDAIASKQPDVDLRKLAEETAHKIKSDPIVSYDIGSPETVRLVLTTTENIIHAALLKARGEK